MFEQWADKDSLTRCAPSLLEAAASLEQAAKFLQTQRTLRVEIDHRKNAVTVTTCADRHGRSRGEVYVEAAPSRSIIFHVLKDRVEAESEHLVAMKSRFNFAGIGVGEKSLRPQRVTLSQEKDAVNFLAEWLDLAAPFVRSDLEKSGMSMPFEKGSAEMLPVKKIVSIPSHTVRYRNTAPDQRYVI